MHSKAKRVNEVVRAGPAVEIKIPGRLGRLLARLGYDASLLVSRKDGTPLDTPELKRLLATIDTLAL
jgi:hypothetical protein